MPLPRSNSTLKRKFLAFNARYFAGKLPLNTIVCYKRTLAAGKKGYRRLALGSCEIETGRAAGTIPTVIAIEPKLKKWETLVDMTLLHECVHLMGVDNHSKHDFDRKMLRLAKAGAFHGRW